MGRFNIFQSIFSQLWMIAFLVACQGCTTIAQSPVDETQEMRPGRFPGKGMVIGLEYAILNNEPMVKRMAALFAETGLTGMKHYPEAVAWGKMQKGPKQDIDFTLMDRFVRHYQSQGFTTLTLCLKPHSRWASKHVGFLKDKNASPKEKYLPLFARWVQAVVLNIAICMIYPRW